MYFQLPTESRFINFQTTFACSYRLYRSVGKILNFRGYIGLWLVIEYSHMASYKVCIVAYRLKGNYHEQSKCGQASAKIENIATYIRLFDNDLKSSRKFKNCSVGLELLL